MKNPKIFYDTIKPKLYPAGMDQHQVDGMNFLITGMAQHQISDLRWAAYMLATVYHECSKTMQPVHEGGKGEGHNYGKMIKHSGVPYVLPLEIYYGRGFVQLTWYENYQLMGRLLHLDLLNNPELAMVPEHALAIMIEGMTKGSSSFGDFTGVCLEMFFTPTKTDWIGARKIINGTDKAELIAGYAQVFYKGLQAGGYEILLQAA